ncbi:hypothetical protein GCM10008927_19550 [Amylibacter ulvae]|uniref:Uncharacterized protein n=1 Tax=Paramylibacter ulvae TaxID=1651968 RepID=A0ABQ3D284_9RHOB|nr:hypothetical protein [Amylibacter ulvae]GHA53757.1 hypothetical protein GCM10008927_19550 [Amylibacter ulvae]
MSHLVTSEKYQSDEIVVEEILIELNDDEVILNRLLEPFEADTLVVIQNELGEIEQFSEVHLEQSIRNARGTIFTGITKQSRKLLFRFKAKGFAKAKVIISQVRSGFASAFKGFPCKLCKMVVKTVVSTILVHLGVPIAPTGEYDFKGFVASVTNAATDIANGVYGQVVQALSSLLPANWWNAVLNVLHLANWMLDATDAFFEKICNLVGMCSPPSQAAP